MNKLIRIHTSFFLHNIYKCCRRCPFGIRKGNGSSTRFFDLNLSLLERHKSEEKNCIVHNLSKERLVLMTLKKVSKKRTNIRNYKFLIQGVIETRPQRLFVLDCKLIKLLNINTTNFFVLSLIEKICYDTFLQFFVIHTMLSFDISCTNEAIHIFGFLCSPKKIVR